jgi:hypothetical protein
MEDRVLSGEINKAQMYKDFTTEYDHIKTWCKPKKFKTWMDIYCENNNIRFEVVKIQGIYYFRF